MIKFVLFTAPFLAVFTNVKSQPTYLIKSAKIDFVFGQGLLTGTRTLIFKDSGHIMRQETTTFPDTSLMSADTTLKIPATQRALFMKQTTSHSLFIYARDTIFTIDLDALVGNSTKVSHSKEDFNVIPVGSKKIGVDTFLGRQCDVFDDGRFKLWYWKGLILKDESTNPDGTKIFDYATMIDEDYVPAQDAFNIPSAVTVNH
jgi:hypothetical protein